MSLLAGIMARWLRTLAGLLELFVHFPEPTWKLSTICNTEGTQHASGAWMYMQKRKSIHITFKVNTFWNVPVTLLRVKSKIEYVYPKPVLQFTKEIADIDRPVT